MHHYYLNINYSHIANRVLIEYVLVILRPCGRAYQITEFKNKIVGALGCELSCFYEVVVCLAGELSHVVLIHQPFL